MSDTHLFIVTPLKLLVLLLIALCGIVVLGMWLGPPTLDLQSWPNYIWQLRLPRLLCAAVVGAGLGLSGAMLQGLFRNPLADPSLIGVSAGAAVGASLLIVVFNTSLAGITGQLAVSVAACVGGFFAVLIVLLLSVSDRRSVINILSNTTMLLVGMAINALGFAVVGLLSYLARDAALRDLISWSLGSFEGLGWSSIALLAAITIPMAVLCKVLAKPLDVLALGQAEAQQLGVSIRCTQWLVVCSSALLVGVGVALAGIIGFIGLIAPHMIRLLVGARHRWLLPLSMLAGALLLVSAEVIARNLLPPVLLPVGVVTAALGAPVFLFLVLRFRHKTLPIDMQP